MVNQHGTSNDRTRGRATHSIPPHQLASSSCSDIGEDHDLSSPASSFFDPQDLHPRLHTLRLPDLRFEQGYLMSIMPFFHFDRAKASTIEPENAAYHASSKRPEDPDLDQNRNCGSTLKASGTEDNEYYFGSNFSVEWKMIIFVTLRDQLIYPLLQGCLWGSASLLLSHIGKARWHSRKKSSTSRQHSPPVARPQNLWDRFISSIWDSSETKLTYSS